MAYKGIKLQRVLIVQICFDWKKTLEWANQRNQFSTKQDIGTLMHPVIE